MGWWVNDPTSHRHTGGWSKSSAKNVARQVRGASASRSPKNTAPGWHRAGNSGCMILVLAWASMSTALVVGTVSLARLFA